MGAKRIVANFPGEERVRGGGLTDDRSYLAPEKKSFDLEDTGN
jgi:hypothetical protein